MIGRGIFDNPWLFTERTAEGIGKDERLATLLRHTKLFSDFWGTRRNFDVMKRFFKIYVSEWHNAKELRAKLMGAKNFEEVKKIINNEQILSSVL
jgi:tRNA-dihydrouridine synthase